MLPRNRLTSVLLTLAIQASAASIRQTYNTTELQWGPCQLNTTLLVQCAKLLVPLDYTDKIGNRTLSLDVIKYPAQKEPKRGSIILNFGGPGQDGLNSMLSYAPIMGPVTGGYHDLISFDPRGTGNTLRFSCWPDDPTNYYAVLGSKMAGSADSAIGTIWAEGQIIADKCYSQLGETGELVGMAFAARDIMSIVDALGEDGLLRYWGISGGTTMGATVAAMFPDRVDKIVLDGVMNAHQYYNSYGEPEMTASTDATWEAFMRGCIANPSNCALAHNRTYASLEATMWDLLTTIRNSPPVFAGTYVLDYSTFKSFLFNSLYSPSHWPSVALALDDLLNGNLTTLATLILGGGGIPQQDQAILGIRCGDKALRTDVLADLEPDFAAYKSESGWFWDWAWGAYVLPCAQWRTRARERYEGGFWGVRTRNPVLFVGNTYDPVTPIVSARNMSAGFEGSVLLTHDACGHTSIPQPSNCTNEAIQRYFLEGTMPAPDTKCHPNVPVFDPKL